ncbi:MAG: helix-turn-helix transcriptional regulator [Magnetococcus sp. YQC-5]
MVVLPFEVYECLINAQREAYDIADALEIRRRIASGEEESIPSEIVDRLLDGPDTKLKVWREYRGLTLRKLAKDAGCSSAYLSEIESGKKSGSVRIMKALALALRVDLDDLV